MEYLKFYELEREPFQNDPDGRFYYESGVHRRARLLVLRGVQQHKALSVLIGGPGCGKTTLARHIFAGLDASEFAARLLSISHSDCGRGWLLPTVAREFGVAKPAGRAPDQLAQIHEALVAQLAKKRHPVLLVDEAQLLSNADAMEEFRGLLNLVHEGRKTISLVLFGLPELRDILRLDAPLAQRVEIRSEVGGLGPDDTKAYVLHRLECAGGSPEIFGADALEALYTYSGGVPRVINTLADNALFEGLLSETKPIDASLVASAAEQLELLTSPGRIGPSPAGAPARPVPASVEPPAVKGGGLPHEDAMAELDLALEEVATNPRLPAAEPSFSDFSMASLVRDESDDEQLGLEDDDEAALFGESGGDEDDLPAPGSRTNGAAQPQPATAATAAEAGEESADDLLLDDDTEPDAGVDLLLDEPEPDDSSVRSEPLLDLSEDESEISQELGTSQELGDSQELGVSQELGSSVDLEPAEDDEELELDFDAVLKPDEPEAPAKPAAPSAATPAPAAVEDADDGDFDPAELLTDLDEEEPEILEAAEIADEAPQPEPAAAKAAAKPAAKPAPAAEEDGEDLDDLFESLQAD